MPERKSTDEGAPPLNLLVEVAEAAAALRQLMPLDAIWTAAERRGDELDGRDREALTGLGARLDSLLASVERHIETVGYLCDAHGDWFDDSVRKALESEHFTEDGRRQALALLKADGEGFAARGAVLAASLSERLPSEREDLRGKFPALRGEGPVVTDMSHSTACDALGVLIMIDLALCIPSEGLGCAIALGTMVGAAAIGC